MLLIETLVEDRSGSVIMDQVLRKMIAAQPYPWTHHVYAHRGSGNFPRDSREKPQLGESTLLPLLGAKLRAYRKASRESTTLLIVVVMDTDDQPREPMFEKLYEISRVEAKTVPLIVGLATEEMEAWMLGDRQAILAAYPDADEGVLDDYEQDSVCGTWEVLCHSILREQAPRLIKIGYPAVGQYKFEWARRIAFHMDLERNQSPSFRRFHADLRSALLTNAAQGGNFETSIS